MTTSVPTPTATLDHAATTNALASGHVLRWWQATAFVEVCGPDAITLLDGLCTQAVERIEPATARLGLFLDAKAKVIAPAVIHRLPDAPWHDPRRPEEPAVDAPRIALETLPACVEPLRAHLARYRLRARASIEPADLGSVALVGDGDHPTGPSAPEDTDGTWVALVGPGRRTTTFVGAAAACREQVARFGACAADPDALEADRIAAGIAGLHDLLPGRMPAEVGGMESAVALDAGCYLGQEPVARLHYRGHANRTLRRVVVVDGGLAPGGDEPEAALEVGRPDAAPDARPVGQVTTWARRGDGTTIALAVLRREVAADEPLVAQGGTVHLRAIDAPDPAA